MDQRFKLAILNSHPIQYFVPLYRRLAQEPKIDLTVYFCSHQGTKTYIDKGFGLTIQWDIPLLEGYSYKFLPNLRRQDRVGGFFSLINPSLTRELQQNSYDALWVHGHNYFSFLLGIISANALQIPVFMRAETHLFLGRSRLKQAIRRPVMSFFYNNLCKRCLPIGTRNREFYLAHNVTPNRLFTLPYTVDNSYFMQAALFKEQVGVIRAELGLPTDKPLLLFISKLTPRKRPLDLLRAYQQLYQQNINAALLFVGSGQLEVDLKHYVTTHKLPDVYFLGFRNQSELPKLYAISDVFVFPSECEPWGLVINEAMCAGLPVVASSEIGAAPDLIKNGYNGFTFPSGDIDQLVTHLKTLLTNDSLRHQMGENSYTLISSWDFEHCVQGILMALESLKQA